MKILWLCNTMLPIIAQARKERVSPYGGWLSGLCDELLEQPDIELIICFPHEKANPVVSGRIQNVQFYGYKETDSNIDAFIEILKESSPHVIHIWGTEYKHTLDMVNAAEKLDMLNKVLINIQGLVSIYGKYHFYCELPEKIYKSASIIEYINKRSITYRRQNMLERGKYEIRAIRSVQHVVGRTDWDEACTKQIHPGVIYHHCNESLRSTFYQYTWNINTCKKHSIFVSQSQTPRKGFHMMLEAMPLILERFPDAHIYTTGTMQKKTKGFKYLISYNTYQKYLYDRIKKSNLTDHVTFLGFLDEQKMCRQYLNSHVFVSPSSIENSSNSVGEAMLLGMPVVSSDVGGIKNLMEHEKEGYIYQQDAPYMLAYYVCKVFENEKKSEEMGLRAREHALKTHDREKNMRDMTAIYRLIAIKTMKQ